MLELQFQTTSKGSQPLSRDEICETILGRQLGYSKGFGWGPKPKSQKAGSSSLSSYEQEMHSREVRELRASFENAQR
ncbi:hypothetical protein E5676_scaffold403G00410 [Cucumis melo var. makuwa]|uniref:Zinc finger protein ZPR1-like protein n=1 Tax=Cucumis melo var. makuwa TaxID=1194695 RepID=A0A5D3DYR4_CUCMM|nr:hypothetical protein E6C27_scaffold114G00550 [Cucumis melo var. makuwa]TYK28721.1 hypothetical protein E5676_scaffold403G00410 [Cucumis melo var. makuwa]